MPRCRTVRLQPPRADLSISEQFVCHSYEECGDDCGPVENLMLYTNGDLTPNTLVETPISITYNYQSYRVGDFALALQNGNESYICIERFCAAKG